MVSLGATKLKCAVMNLSWCGTVYPQWNQGSLRHRSVLYAESSTFYTVSIPLQRVIGVLLAILGTLFR